MRVLVVEDTADLGEGMVGCVGRMGHAVDWARDGAEADAILRDTPYELVVLDLSLPELDGVAVLRNLRARRQAVPVLVVTARSEIDERVTVLDQGADDYLVKPFDFREFEARVRSLLRRRDGELAAWPFEHFAPEKDREARLEMLLELALQGTFPASDPIAISVEAPGRVSPARGKAP